MPYFLFEEGDLIIGDIFLFLENLDFSFQPFVIFFE